MSDCTSSYCTVYIIVDQTLKDEWGLPYLKLTSATQVHCCRGCEFLIVKLVFYATDNPTTRVRQ